MDILVNNNTDNITTVDTDDVFLPEGWGEGDDIFADPESWTGGKPADEPAEGQEKPEGTAPAETGGEAAPTPEQQPAGDAAGAETGAAPTNEPNPAETAPTPEPTKQDAPHTKLKFKAKIDREDREVEVDESDLPSLYQRAQNHDRAQNKLARLSPLVDSAEAMARMMGYDNLQAMIDKAEEGYRESEVRRLKREGVHEEVARDMVQRRMEEAGREAKEKEQEETNAPAGARNFRTETAELLRQRPELQGKKLPEEVVKSCIYQGKNLMVAYAEYEANKEKAEAESLRQRIRILEQNQASAAKAPVKGAVGGGAADTKPEDPFLMGFDSDR